MKPILQYVIDDANTPFFALCRSPLGVQDPVVDWLYERASAIEGGENLFARPIFRLEAGEDPHAYEEAPLEECKGDPSLSTMKKRVRSA